MIAIITGDIINSRKVNSEIWLPELKEYFSKIITNRDSWEIYRGDSFQLEVKVTKAFDTVLAIKALIKTHDAIDVRMAIGIGEEAFSGLKVTESYGTAHINSGESFENLKNYTLIIKSPFSAFDDYFNPILKLVSFITDNWKPVTAETIFYALNNKNLLQKEIAKHFAKDSTTINKALKRGAYDELSQVQDLYAKKIATWLP